MQELFKDIIQKKIDVVLTYKIDRFTRSLKDFYSVIEFFEKYNVAYVSVTEKFDTSSPAGRLLRNIMLTFAQFEREMTSERIKDKFEQMAIRGRWCVGLAPFGYKNEDKKLAVNKKKALLVRMMFEKYVETGSLKSVMDLVKQNKISYSDDGNLYSINSVFWMLRNPVYTGKVRWNNNIYDGMHDPIISKELYDEAQLLMTKKVRKKSLYKEFMLSGLIQCSDCNSSMTNSFTNKIKRRYYYYKCVKVVKEGKGACSVKEVNAEKLESFLIENLSRIADDKQYIENLAFRLAYKTPRRVGFELKEESFEKLITRVQQVLINFKNKMENSTQMEKCITFEKTIQKIRFSKDSLEVVISIKDTTNDEILNLSGLGLRHAAARIRGVHRTPAPPSALTSSNSNTSERLGFEPRDPFYQVNRLAGDSVRPLRHLSKNLSSCFLHLTNSVSNKTSRCNTKQLNHQAVFKTRHHNRLPSLHSLITSASHFGCR